MSHLPFPLPEGHMFANVISPRCHRGDDPLDRIRLASAQRRLRFVWGSKDVAPSGVYDGPTLEAVGLVQRANGLPVNGWLDAETWGVLWEDPPVTHLCT